MEKFPHLSAIHSDQSPHWSNLASGGVLRRFWPFLLHGLPVQSRMSVSVLSFSRSQHVGILRTTRKQKPPKTTCAGRNQKKNAWNIMELLKIRQCSNHGQMLQPPLQYLNSHGCHLPLKYNQQHQFRSEMMWVGHQEYNSQPEPLCSSLQWTLVQN